MPLILEAGLIYKASSMTGSKVIERNSVLKTKLQNKKPD